MGQIAEDVVPNQVIDVEFDLAIEWQIGATADLPHAGQSRLAGQPPALLRTIARDLVWQRRARSDQRHLAQQHVQQLRQLADRTAA
jgi:hypothetical protein